MTALSEEERRYYRLNRLVYPRLAPVYDGVAVWLRPLRHVVVDLVPLAAGARVLDVATGTGGQARAFAAKAREVVGVDICEEMLRIARRKNRFDNVSFQHADATDLPFVDASFDVACISFALHEMPLGVRERVVREMVRVTRPGGSIVVVDYGLPENALGRSLAFHLIKLYERDHYATFIHSDRVALLRDAGIEGIQERSALLGIGRVTIGRRPAEHRA